MNSKINIAIVGGAGYTGGELIRVLLQHPNVNIAAVHSRSNGNKPLHHVHTDLEGDTHLVFTSDFEFLQSTQIDVLFLCLGHGESKIFLTENEISNQIKIIDLTNDFRLNTNAKINDRKFIYGLPELNYEAIKVANSIANPGCFATAIQLALLPLAKINSLPNTYVTGITGSTGAGQSLSATSHFSWRANNIQAYKSLTHQHLDEINQSIVQLQSQQTQINFVPWRGDFARGIFISAQTQTNLSLEALYALYQQYYSNAPFVIVSKNAIHLKQVVNTNKCIIQLELHNNNLVVHAAIDNLLKGAVGQAVQNMNLMLRLNETTGLHLKSIAF